jgi:hypothetical protein
MCVDCTARKSAAKRAKEQCTQGAVSGETRGRKRRVLGDTDPNVQRKHLGLRRTSLPDGIWPHKTRKNR